jgi:hypothetical protein
MDEKEIIEKVEKRLRDLMLVVRHTAASDAADEALAAIPSSEGDVTGTSVVDGGRDIDSSEDVETEV